MDQTRFLSFRN